MPKVSTSRLKPEESRDKALERLPSHAKRLKCLHTALTAIHGSTCEPMAQRPDGSDLYYTDCHAHILLLAGHLNHRRAALSTCLATLENARSMRGWRGSLCARFLVSSVDVALDPHPFHFVSNENATSSDRPPNLRFVHYYSNVSLNPTLARHAEHTHNSIECILLRRAMTCSPC